MSDVARSRRLHTTLSAPWWWILPCFIAHAFSDVLVNPIALQPRSGTRHHRPYTSSIQLHTKHVQHLQSCLHGAISSKTCPLLSGSQSHAEYTCA
jgi:hypothetical protein